MKPLSSAHPTVNDELPNRLACGSVIIKPNVQSFTEHGVVFDDGTSIDHVDEAGYVLQPKRWLLFRWFFQRATPSGFRWLKAVNWFLSITIASLCTNWCIQSKLLNTIQSQLSDLFRHQVIIESICLNFSHLDQLCLSGCYLQSNSNWCARKRSFVPLKRVWSLQVIWEYGGWGEQQNFFAIRFHPVHPFIYLMFEPNTLASTFKQEKHWYGQSVSVSCKQDSSLTLFMETRSCLINVKWKPKWVRIPNIYNQRIDQIRYRRTSMLARYGRFIILEQTGNHFSPHVPINIP